MSHLGDLIDGLRTALADRYRLEQELGHGGMATVFVARDLKHGRQVALKVLRPELGAVLGPERFVREIAIAAGFTHPHILPLYDSGVAAGLLYYVMPLVEGESLGARLGRERQLSVEDAVRIASEIADALEYAHSHGVLHRDIKPENILLESGHAVVSDFGIARAVEAAGGERLTQSGIAVGTPIYMSPEQAAAEPDIDGRSDVYSLGCVVYEMLAGEPPYRAATAQALFAKRLSEPVPHLRTVRDVPEALDRAVTKALAKSPADRFPTARAFRAALGTADPSAPRGPRRRLTRRVLLGVPFVVLAVATALYWQRRSSGIPSSVSSIHSIAVLPLENLSGNPEDEYFSDGMTDELMTALSSVPGLRVASRTSAFVFKGSRNADVREIGRRLNVMTVLEGTVRRGGNRLRVRTQLTNVGDGLALWSESYEREPKDVFQVQDEISQAVVRALTPTLTGGAAAHLARRGTVNLAAYDLYLRARFAFNKFTEPALRESIRLYEEALGQDPRYPLAWAGIAESWLYLADDYVAPRGAYPKAKDAALRALELDSTLAEAHAVLGIVLLSYEWDLRRGGAELRQALAVDPKLFLAQFGYHGYLIATGQLDSAAAVLTHAQSLDPLSVLNALILGRFFAIIGRYDQSIDEYRRALELVPDLPPALLGIGDALLALGRTAEADTVFRAARKSLPASMEYLLASAAAGLGRRGESLRLVGEMEREAGRRYIRPEAIAAVYARLGDRDRAFQWLDRALEARSPYLLALNADRQWDPIRQDARFTVLVRKVGLP